ncbi:hypothetical protein RRG08_001619 [Elysia crispata]|uniref:Uncharacterized protein n=1 Tax=Elysia crispata TaxID=231223 RepID=A0AAE1AJT0_9GAST|nr:hypothetical protein RRG08_001619 [Elysia crispata]
MGFRAHSTLVYYADRLATSIFCLCRLICIYKYSGSASKSGMDALSQSLVTLLDLPSLILFWVFGPFLDCAFRSLPSVTEEVHNNLASSGAPGATRDDLQPPSATNEYIMSHQPFTLKQMSYAISYSVTCPSAIPFHKTTSSSTIKSSSRHINHAMFVIPVSQNDVAMSMWSPPSVAQILVLNTRSQFCRVLQPAPSLCVLWSYCPH